MTTIHQLGLETPWSFIELHGVRILSLAALVSLVATTTLAYFAKSYLCTFFSVLAGVCFTAILAHDFFSKESTHNQLLTARIALQATRGMRGRNAALEQGLRDVQRVVASLLTNP